MACEQAPSGRVFVDHLSTGCWRCSLKDYPNSYRRRPVMDRTVRAECTVNLNDERPWHQYSVFLIVYLLPNFWVSVWFLFQWASKTWGLITHKIIHQVSVLHIVFMSLHIVVSVLHLYTMINRCAFISWWISQKPSKVELLVWNYLYYQLHSMFRKFLGDYRKTRGKWGLKWGWLCPHNLKACENQRLAPDKLSYTGKSLAKIEFVNKLLKYHHYSINMLIFSFI